MQIPPQQPDPPSLRRAAAEDLLIAIPAAALAALVAEGADALITLMIFGGVNVAFIYSRQVLNNRRR
ncbi:MAG TPA: hypothetical protein VM690_01745 [Gaiellaceae bacterium]|nr:hypothetical protein [Gaiellaceae bacterium]